MHKWVEISSARSASSNPAFDPGPRSRHFPSDLPFIPIPTSPPAFRLLRGRSTRALGSNEAPTH